MSGTVGGAATRGSTWSPRITTVCCGRSSSKAYNPANAVTKADVDKFLSESSRAVFSYRLLIATTDKLHHVARRTIDAQEKHVAFLGLSDLFTSAVEWRTDPLDMRPSPPPKAAKPREHQREAIKAVVKGFTKSDRGQLIMACGTGKTLTSLFINEKLDCARWGSASAGT
jgi:predicted helicase